MELLPYNNGLRYKVVGISGIFIVFSPFLVFVPQVIAFYLLIKRRQLGWGNSWTAGVLLLFIWSFLVGVFNGQLISAVTSLSFLGFYAVSLYLHHHCQTTEKIEKLFRHIFFLTQGSAIFGLMENFGLIDHTGTWWKYCFGLTTLVANDDNLFRITGTFGNPNLAASWYAVMILVGLYFYDKTQGKERRILFIGLILLIGVLVMTGCRGAIIGLLIGLVVYDFVGGRTIQWVVRVFVLITGLTVLLGFPELFPRGDLLSSTIDLRWAIWENCFNMFLKKPVTGWGIMGIYYADDNVYQYLRVLHAHNMLISLAAMLGLVGILILTWMEGHLLLQLWQLHKENCPLVPLLAAVQAIFWGHGVLDFTAMAPQIGLLFMVFSSIIGTLADSQISSSQIPWLKGLFIGTKEDQRPGKYEC